MKVLLVEPYGDRMGHYGLFAAHIAQEMATLGHEVTLLAGIEFDPSRYLRTRASFRVMTLGLKDFYRGHLPQRCRRLRMFLDRLRLIWVNAVTLASLLRLVAREPFDAIHLLDWEPLSTAALLSCSRVVTRVSLPRLSIHLNPVDFSWAKHGRNPLKGIYIILARVAIRFTFLRFCSVVTVQGDWHREKSRHALRLSRPDAPPMVVVRPGTLLPEQEVPQAAARCALGVEPNKTLFLFFGILGKHKGIETLLAAIAGASGNAHLLIAGAPYNWTPHTLQARINASGCQHKVRAYVRYIPQEETATYFAAADAVILPYSGNHYAGGYGPMMLACGYGKPLIVSDVGEMGWLVRTCRCGYAVGPDDVSALRQALDAFVYLAEVERAQMGARARKLAEENSFARVARRLSDVFSMRAAPGGQRLKVN